MQIFSCACFFSLHRRPLFRARKNDARRKKRETFSLNEIVRVPWKLRHKAPTRREKTGEEENFLISSQFMFEQNNHIFKWHLKLFQLFLLSLGMFEIYVPATEQRQESSRVLPWTSSPLSIGAHRPWTACCYFVSRISTLGEKRRNI